jgi:hypothetical protein
MKSIGKYSLIALAFASFGCGAQAPKRSAPQAVLSATELRADHSLVVEVPKVDILFVVDNSMSMKVHQEKLAQNISEFVEEFSSKATLDYHIGVVTIWDHHPGHDIAVGSEHPKGALIPLQIPVDSSPENLNNPKSFMSPRQNLLVNGTMPPRYVTKNTENKIPILKSTLFLGEEWGPQYEEMFSPVLSFFEAANLNGPNAGFLRSDAYLLVVFITDANDGSVIKDASGNDVVVTPQMVKDTLYATKQGVASKVRIFGILSPTGSQCREDAAGRPYKFNELLRITNGKQASLCSDFGSQLASYGRDFSSEVSRQVIPNIPNPDENQTFSVSYGSQVVPKATAGHLDEGWSYNPNLYQITIGGNLKLKPEPGAQIKVDLTPVTLENLPNSPTMTPPLEPGTQTAPSN